MVSLRVVGVCDIDPKHKVQCINACLANKESEFKQIVHAPQSIQSIKIKNHLAYLNQTTNAPMYTIYLVKGNQVVLEHVYMLSETLIFLFFTIGGESDVKNVSRINKYTDIKLGGFSLCESNPVENHQVSGLNTFGPTLPTWP